MAPANLEGEATVAFGQARAGEDVEAVDRLQGELLAGGLGRALADAAFDFGGGDVDRDDDRDVLRCLLYTSDAADE